MGKTDGKVTYLPVNVSSLWSLKRAEIIRVKKGLVNTSFLHLHLHLMQYHTASAQASRVKTNK